MSENQFGAGAAGESGLPSDATDYILELEEVAPDAADSVYAPGQEFAEHRLVRLVSSEPMAELWEAYDSQLDCARAIKIMRPQVAQDEQTVDDFFRQARSQARLQHPNILQVQRVGRSGATGIPFFISEWVDGESLEQRLQRDGAMAPVAAWDILRQIVSGLGYAHEQGMIHRDLHPGNILLENPIRDSGDRRFRARIKDFGLAAILDAPLQGKGAVLPGSKPEYTAPEIVAGMEITHRADIYSLGLLLYHMLTGFPPFQGSKRGEVLFKQVHDPLPAVSPQVREAIGAEGMAIFARMTQKRPDLRYGHYNELLEATKTSPIMDERRKAEPVAAPQPQLLAGGTETPKTSILAPAPPSSGRKLFPLAAAAAIIVAAGAFYLAPKFQDRGSVANPEPLLANSPAPAPESAQPLTAPSPEINQEAVEPETAEPEAEAAAPVVAEATDSDSEGAASSFSGSPIPSLKTSVETEKAAAEETQAEEPASAAADQPSGAPAGSGTQIWSSLVAGSASDTPGEIIVDNATPGALRLAPTSPGIWRNSSLPGAHAYSSLLATADGTEKTATFLADIPRAGEYEVHLSWISGGANTRSDSVVCIIHTAEGPFKGIIDQTGPSNTGAFFPVGSYQFAAGKSQPIVTISTEKIEPGSDRMVSVDALKLVLASASGDAPAVAQEEAEPVDSASGKLPAGAIVVESGAGGKNSEQYQEISGRWLDSRTPAVAAKSSATGLSQAENCPGRKFVFSTVGSDTPAEILAEARFHPELALPGRFHVYVTWPHGGNVTPVHYVIKHANGSTTRTLTQDGYGPGPGTPNNANVWIRLGDFEFAPGKGNYVGMLVQPGARAVHTTANGQAYADAVCFSPLPVDDAQDDDQTSTRSIMPVTSPAPSLASR